MKRKNKYFGGRKETYYLNEMDVFIDTHSEYLIKEEHHLKVKRFKIKQLLLNNMVFFGVLSLLSLLLYCINHLIKG